MTKKILNPIQNPGKGIMTLDTQVKGFFGFGFFWLGLRGFGVGGRLIGSFLGLFLNRNCLRIPP